MATVRQQLTPDSSARVSVSQDATPWTSSRAPTTLRRYGRLTSTATMALAALDAAGVDAVLLKGPALRGGLLEPGEARGYEDVDLLDRPAISRPRGWRSARRGIPNALEPFGIDEIAAYSRFRDLGTDGETAPVPVS